MEETPALFLASGQRASGAACIDPYKDP